MSRAVASIAFVYHKHILLVREDPETLGKAVGFCRPKRHLYRASSDVLIRASFDFR